MTSVAVGWAFSDFLKSTSPLSWSGAIFVSAAATIYLIYYALDRVFLQSRWTLTDLVKLTFWRTAFPVGALVLVAAGCDALYRHRLVGISWLLVAALVARVGEVMLRLAEGMKFKKVKSGPLYKRAFLLAKQMGTELKRVYIVPSGRGHLANAYGGRGVVAVTDNYGKFLDGAKLDFVIGHELAHGKCRHGRKELLTVMAVYGLVAVLCFIYPQSIARFRPLVDLVVILGPVLGLYFQSRHFEYEADRVAVDLTRDPEAAIEGLIGLYRVTDAPTDYGGFTELFMTHPSLVCRIRAIGKAGNLTQARLSELVCKGKSLGVAAGE